MSAGGAAVEAAEHERYVNPSLALVTGSSRGIGRSLAQVLAEQRYDLYLVADEAEVYDVGQEFADAHGVQVVSRQLELTDPEDVETLATELRAASTPLSVAALNAGVIVNGAFLETAVNEHLRLVDVNCRATVHVAGAVVPLLVDNGGRLLITSSVAASAPNPYQATYGASKAFLSSFAGALRHEVQRQGVTVTTLLPGPTDTAMLSTGSAARTRIAQGPKSDPDEVAREAYDATAAGRPSVISGGAASTLQVLLGNMLPERVLAAVTAPFTRPRR